MAPQGEGRGALDGKGQSSTGGPVLYQPPAAAGSGPGGWARCGGASEANKRPTPTAPLQGLDRDLVGRGVLTHTSLPRDGKRPGQSLTSRSGELGEGRVAEIQEEAYARGMRGACETGRERCGAGHTKTRAAHGPVLRSWDPTLPRGLGWMPGAPLAAAGTEQSSCWRSRRRPPARPLPAW